MSGRPVLCLVIIQGVVEQLNVETGIDISAEPHGTPDDTDFFDNNFGPGKLYPGGLRLRRRSLLLRRSSSEKTMKILILA